MTKVKERVEFSARQHGDGQKALLKRARASGRGVAAWEEFREGPIRRFSRDDYRTYRRVELSEPRGELRKEARRSYLALRGEGW